MVVEEMAVGPPERKLVDARTGNALIEGEEHRARGARHAEGAEPVGAVADDCRDMGERLDVVDGRRLAEQAGLPRVGRLLPRPCLAPLDDFEGGRLLARDVARRCRSKADLEREGGAEDPRAEKSCRVSVGDRTPRALERLDHILDEVEVGDRGAGRERAERRSLEDFVGILRDEKPVLAAPGLVLAAIGDDVSRSLRGRCGELPLPSRRERRAAAPAKLRVPDEPEHVGGRQVLDRFP